MGYWKWFKDKYIPKKAAIIGLLIVIGYFASLCFSYFIPFYALVFLGWNFVLGGALSLVFLLVYGFFSYSYICYLTEKKKKGE